MVIPVRLVSNVDKLLDLSLQWLLCDKNRGGNCNRMRHAHLTGSDGLRTWFSIFKFLNPDRVKSHDTTRLIYLTRDLARLYYLINTHLLLCRFSCLPSLLGKASPSRPIRMTLRQSTI